MDTATSKSNLKTDNVVLFDLKAFPADHPVVRLSVGGKLFETSLSTLCRFPNSMLEVMFAGLDTMPVNSDGYHFIDRDGTHFRHILNFLRSPETFELSMTGFSLLELKAECDYFGLTEHMFPTVIIAPFRIHSLDIQQNEFGIYNMNNKPVRVCMHCDCGDSGLHEFLPSFKKVVKAKGGVIDAAQPRIQSSGQICRYCSR